MFEKEIKFVADFSLNKIKNLGSSFTFEKLLTSDLHPAILRYISAELDYLVYEDRKKLLQQSVFDYSGPETTKLFTQINEQIKKTKRISYEDIRKLVIQAVSFNVNFVCRPKWSLVKLVYDNSDIKPVEEIKLMFSYLYFYDYIKNIFLAYCSKRKLVNISLIEFELVLNKIDKELFDIAQAKKLVDNALYSMADFLNIGGVYKSKLSISPVEIFLREKNLIEYLFRLKKALPAGSKNHYEVEEIRKIIYSALPFDQQQVIQLKEEEQIKETEPTEEEKPGKAAKPLKEESIEEVVEETRWEEDKKAFNEEISEDENIEEETGLGDLKDILEIEELAEVPEESELEDDEIILESPDEGDELLKMYDEELKQLEKEAEEISTDTDEIKFDISQKDHLDELYDFEDEERQEEEITDEKSSPAQAVRQELEFSDEYEISDENNDEAVTEEIKKLEIPDEIDEAEEAEEDAKLKKNYEFRKEEFDHVIKEESALIPSEQKKKPRPELSKDLFSYISNKEIDKIVSNIFNEDREDFTNTMERISECDSYEEATEILKGVFFSYRVNPYSRDAVTLTSAVSNYFDQA